MGSRVVAISVVALAACSSRVRRDLEVVSVTPQGSVDTNQPIELHFDKPVVDEAVVGTAVDASNVAIEPAVPWKGFWRDRQTLVVEPTAELTPSTRYSIALTGELGARTDDYVHAFVYRRLAVEGVWGVDGDSLATDGDVPISFSLPVRDVDAAQHCKLVGDHGEIALSAVIPGKTAANLALHPATRLDPGASYRLTCSDLSAAGGNVGLAKPYSLAVKARPRFSIATMTPDGASDVAADEVSITIEFTTPVTLDAARKAITAKPAITGFDQGSLGDAGTVYTVTADLDAHTAYTISVAPMVDSFGQKLEAVKSASFKTGDARPRIAMERGIFAVEASARGYPLWSRNVTSYTVECGAIPKSRIVQVLTTDMNYDPWGGNNDDKPIEWSKLGVTSRSATHAPAGRNKWLLDELDLGSSCGTTTGKRGVYLAEVRSDDVKPDPSHPWRSVRRNRVLANVTDMGVLIKAGAASGIVWVTSLTTGQPVANARVSVFTPAGKQVYAATTNADGLIEMPGTATFADTKPTDEGHGDWDNYRQQRLIAIVEHDNDTAVVDGNWANGIQVWNFGFPEDRRAAAVRIRGFIQSDRGLYRPGESVHFKGLARAIASGRPPAIPRDRDVLVEVQDSRGQVVTTSTTKLSAFGGFGFDMDLSSDATLGDYYVAATVGGQVFRERFTVEEFRPAAFELAVTSGQKAPHPGDRLTFDVDARYLFGSAVASSKLEWNLRKRKHVLRFAGYDDYTFASDPNDYYWIDPSEDYGEMVSNGTGTTDAKGHYAIAARDNATKVTGPVDYIVSASVTDSSDQTITSSAVVPAHKTGFYLGMHANEFVQAVDMPFGVNLVAVAPDGARVAASAVKLSFVRIARTCTWHATGSRGVDTCTTIDTPDFERTIDIEAGGSHTERIYPTKPGQYVVKAVTKDAAGNDVAVASSIYVIGKGEAFWSGDEGDRMTVVTSKPSYKPGDVAKLVPQANLVAPTALVTIERDGVMDARVQKMTSASDGIEVTIADAMAPNVFASIAMVSGRHGTTDKDRPQFKMGIAELKVSSAHKQLEVAVTLDHDKVRPGDKVTGKIHVSSAGAPVKAEVSLSAADEGVLQLIAYKTPNPMTTFYATYGLGVDSGTSWNRIARLADPQAGDPDAGGDRASKLGNQRVRSKFVASAYWAPMLVSDGNGDISFSFVAPDNLSAFRLMAVAADIADRFGAGETRLTVHKPLMVTPVLPRFLRASDTATVGVVLHNTTSTAGTATVTASATGATLTDPSQSVIVPANGEVRVHFDTRPGAADTATYEFAATLGSEHDAARVSIPIERLRHIETRAVAAKLLAAGETWTGSLAIGNDVIKPASTLAITVDKTGLGSLEPSLRELVEYPYGCLEQTLSRLVPLIAAKDLTTTLATDTLRGSRVEQFVAAGVAKVIRHQQGDGLFSLWPQSQTYPHLAAFALWGLTVANNAGVAVPSDTFDRGVRALSSWADAPGNLKPDGAGATAAMAAYVMALRGKTDAGLNSRLYGLRTGLPKWGQAFLLRALVVGKGDKAQIDEIERLVASGVTVSGGIATVHEPTDSLYWSSDARATAMTLDALVEVDPASPLVEPLAKGVMSQHNESTQENLWALVALADYAKKRASGGVTATVTVGGKLVATKTLTGAEVGSIKIPIDQLTGDRVEVHVDQPAHASVRVIEARDDAGTASAHGFTLTREYVDAKGRPLVHTHVGDVVTVKLHVSAPDDHRWIALVDPLPAGLEVVNPKLQGQGAPTASSDPWQHTHWDHQDMRDDRVQWFTDRFWRGTYELTYTARATMAGTFSTMPASVEAMYQPDLRGRSSSTPLSIDR